MKKFEFPVPGAHVIWDTKPASDWAQGYPLGDGRRGAMVHGAPGREVASLNHALLWRDYMQQPVQETYKDMPEIKRLCKAGDWKAANALLLESVPHTGETVYINSYVPACDLYITISAAQGEVQAYKRALDLQNGIACSSFTADGVTYYSESFCSQETQTYIMHLVSSVPGRLTGEVSLSRIGDCECTETGYAGYDFVHMDACFEEGVHFSARAQILHRNGRLTGGKKTYDVGAVSEKHFGNACVFDRDEELDARKGASVCFDSCDEVWIVTALAVQPETEAPEAAVCAVCKDVCATFQYDEIRRAQCERFSKYYSGMRLKLAEADAFASPTPELIEKCRADGGFSPALTELTWNMSRYTVIAAGMPGKNDAAWPAPINLQGLWCRDTRPVWQSDYHPDLNIEMCYWPIAGLGLADFMEKLLLWVERLLPNAVHCAADLFGARGAAYNGCADYKTLGIADDVIGGCVGFGAWFAQILWIYYEHKPEESILKRIYALMEKMAEFYEDILEECDGVLKLPFGTSPEMGLCIDGERQWLSSPSTFEVTLLLEFYENYRTAAQLLGENAREKHCVQILSKLQRPTILDDGTLCEWTYPHEEAEVGHRHRSPMVGFCPGSLYSLEKTPEMCAATEKLLQKRRAAGNSGAAAFSYALDAQILARLQQGDAAYENLHPLVQMHLLDNLMVTINDYAGRGGLSWFPGIKVMQVDAQIGFSAAVAEFFWQDRGGIVRVLPALPAALAKQGSIQGIRGRNGFACDIEWADGKVVDMRLYSALGRACVLALPKGACGVRIDGASVHIKDGFAHLDTKKDAIYKVEFQYEI